MRPTDHLLPEEGNPRPHRVAAARAAARKDWLEAVARWERYAEMLGQAGTDLSEADRRRLQKARVAAALHHRQEGRPKEAEQIAARVVREDPDSLPGWREYAKAAAAQGDWAASAERWERLVDAADQTGDTLPGAVGARAAKLVELRREGMPRLAAEVSKGALCFVESGADPVLLRMQLSQLAPAAAYGEGSVGGVRYGEGQVVPINDQFTRGDREDMRLGEQARRTADGLLDALRQALDDLSVREAMPLVDVVRDEFASRALAHLRVLEHCDRLLDPARFPGVVFVRGNGRLVALLANLAVTRFGSARTHAVSGDPNAGDAALQLERLSRRPGEKVAAMNAQAAAMRADPSAKPAETSTRRGNGGVLVLAWPDQHRTLVPVVAELIRDTATTVACMTDDRAVPRYYEQLEPGGCVVEVPLPPDSLRTRPSPDGPRAVVDAQRVAAHPAVQAALAASGNAAVQMADDLRSLVRTTFPRLRWMTAVVKRLLDQRRPSLVVVERDRNAEVRAVLDIARRRDIPSLAIQPSLMNDNPLYGPLCADYSAVFDTYSARLFVEHFDARPDRLFLTGFPSYDRTRSDSHSQPGGPRDQPVVLVTMQRYAVAQAERLLHAVLDAVRSLPDTELVVKLHPTEPYSRLERYEDLLRARGAGVPAAVVRHADARRLIDRADVVVSSWSGTLVEAALSGTPALSVRFDRHALPIPLDELGVSHAVRVDDVRTVLPRLVHPSPLRTQVRRRQQAYLADNPHLAGGVSSARLVADAARSILGRERASAGAEPVAGGSPRPLDAGP